MNSLVDLNSDIKELFDMEYDAKLNVHKNFLNAFDQGLFDESDFQKVHKIHDPSCFYSFIVTADPKFSA